MTDTNITKEQAGFDAFRHTDTYAMLVEYMSADPNVTPWTVENRIWTAYRAGWLKAQHMADSSAVQEQGPKYCMMPVPTMPDGEPAPCSRLYGHDGDCENGPPEMAVESQITDDLKLYGKGTPQPMGVLKAAHDKLVGSDSEDRVTRTPFDARYPDEPDPDLDRQKISSDRQEGLQTETTQRLVLDDGVFILVAGEELSFHETKEVALDAGRQAIKDMYDAASLSWGEDVDAIFVAELIAVSHETDRVFRPDEDQLDDEGFDPEGIEWPPDVEYICDYELVEISDSSKDATNATVH